MHIGMITETYPPEINGVALTVQGLVSGLRERGHRVSLVRPRQEADRDIAGGDGELLVAGASIPRYPGLRFGWPAGRRLRRQWSADAPDAIYVATEGPLGASALRVARRLGIPAISGFHTRFDFYASHYGLGWLTPLIQAHLRRFHRRAAATLVPTDALAAELRGIGVDNVRLLHRAVDTEQFHPQHRDDALRRAWGAGTDDPVALYVGRIAPEKNLQLAVRAYQRMREARPGMRFVWVGDGPSRAALEKAHPEMVFAGMRHGDDLARHYASADLFVFPSLSETFGNVVLEALASAVPCVAFDCGAAHEHLQHDSNGFPVAQDDEDGFLDACAQLVQPPCFQRMRTAARASMAQLSPDAVLADFEALMREVIRQRAAQPGADDGTDQHPSSSGARP